jgi:hypothetical protein
LEGRGPVSHEVRVSALADEIRGIEERLDPGAHKKGQRIADAITFAVLLPLVIALEWYVRYPLLMFGLMVAGLALNRVPPLVARRRLQKEHDKLFDQYQEILELASALPERSAEQDE